jgi:hypothetical protein
MYYFFPDFTYGPVLNHLILHSIVGVGAYILVFRTKLFNALLENPLVPTFLTVPAVTLIFISGLLAAQIWQSVGHAQNALSDEKRALSRIYHSVVEPQELRLALRTGAESYVSLVQDVEWGRTRNQYPAAEVERALVHLGVMLRASLAQTNEATSTAQAARGLLRDLDMLEDAREKRLDLGGRVRSGYISTWIILYFMLLISAINITAVHRRFPHTAAIALCLYCLSMAMLFSIIALSIHPYQGPNALPPASLVVK